MIDPADPRGNFTKISYPELDKYSARMGDRRLLGNHRVELRVADSPFTWFGHRTKRKSNDRIGEEDDVRSIDEEFDQVTGPKKFSYKDLVAATDDFADSLLLGKGGSGRVYEGCLIGMNANVAIKKMTPESRHGMKEYATKVKTIRRLRHRNLVQLVGWCHEEKGLLIYEFMSNGSLDCHLFKDRTFLMREKRYGIEQGIASALLYLHEEWEQCSNGHGPRSREQKHIY
ncbi:L-type lectin-domain containing receptor kinase IX.1-like [Rhodamnia argentea]|uniref:L-type lectin-domain containing receptor kinase IX.1-like n=1 Tax=Rhodamnia argentea TaxID=178133 RepID=A0ABM3HVY4_9MYRT|nr:L-type lectin-domain containing receptor kinase IX.1-like [Rhodamnia argentea]